MPHGGEEQLPPGNHVRVQHQNIVAAHTALQECMVDVPGLGVVGHSSSFWATDVPQLRLETQGLTLCLEAPHKVVHAGRVPRVIQKVDQQTWPIQGQGGAQCPLHDIGGFVAARDQHGD